MKTFHLLTCGLLLIVTFVNADQPATGPSGTVCESPGGSCKGLPDGVLIPYEDDCTKFIQCFLGCGCDKECSGGLHFNSKLQVCDWPKSAGCDPTYVDPPTTGPSGLNCESSGELCKNSTDGTVFPNENDCTMYIECSMGCEINRDCAPGTHFSEELKQCTWPSIAGCDPSIVTPSPPGPITPSPEPTPSPPTPSPGPTPSPCTPPCTPDPPTPSPGPTPSPPTPSPEPTPSPCTPPCTPDPPTPSPGPTPSPPTPAPEPTPSPCTPPCTPDPPTPSPGPTPSPPTPAPEPTPSPCTPDPPAPSPEPTPCPPAPSPEPTPSPCTPQCPPPTCPATTPSPCTPSTPTPSPVPTPCPCPTPSPPVPPTPAPCPCCSHSSNTPSSSCDTPKPTSKPTPSSSQQVPSIESSEESFKKPTTSSKPSSTSQPLKPTPRPSQNSCSGKESGTLLAYIGSCSKYIACADGTAYIMDCGSGLHFNAAIEMCDWPEQAGCDPSYVKPEKEPSCQSKGASCLGKEDGKLLPYAGNCEWFVACYDGCGFDMACGKGLQFNRNSEVCDWPEVAGCDFNKS